MVVVNISKKTAVVDVIVERLNVILVPADTIRVNQRAEVNAITIVAVSRHAVPFPVGTQNFEVKMFRTNVNVVLLIYRTNGIIIDVEKPIHTVSDPFVLGLGEKLLTLICTNL